MRKLNKILSQSVQSFQLNVHGNAHTNYAFIAEELDVSTPNSIDNCSLQIFDGIQRLKDELEVINTANAVIDVDSDDPSKLVCDLTMKERSRLTATIGASHDVHATSQLNGSLSVGVRNLFGNGEKLDLSADLGLGTTNQSSLSLSRKSSVDSANAHEHDEDAPAAAPKSSIYNIVHNTSNQYSITFSKPRVKLPFVDKELVQQLPIFNDEKSNLVIKGFQQKLDRSRSSSYREDSLGSTVSLISYNQQHCLSYNYHLRSLIPTLTLSDANGVQQNVAMVGGDAISSPSIADESTMMSTKSSVSYRFVKDTRNHPSVPSQGYLVTNETELSGLGGDVDFLKMSNSLYYHYSLPRITTNVDPPDVTAKWKAILNIGVQTGFVLPWKRRLLSAAKRSHVNDRSVYGDRHIRIIDRLIPMGGLQLRGFEHGQVGPKDRSDYVHCDFLLAGGISLCMPVAQWLYANVFVNVSHCQLLRNIHSMQDIVNSGCASTGISAIIPFPVGRLEVGYAHPLKVNDNPFSSLFWAFDVQYF